jgi:hypothetical protein
MISELAELTGSAYLIAALALGLLGAILVVAGLVALFRARPLGFAVRTLTGLLLVTLGALAGTVALGIQGYQALTHEEVAARIMVKPTGPQRFTASVRFPDNREARFDIAGDEIYVDAHILKWKPMANVLGLHTAYELARISGRYRAIEDERSAPRTVHSLRVHRAVDLFAMRQRHAFLGRFFDAEYGSATFVPVTRPAEYEVRVSTTGLLMREVSRPGA